MGNAGLGRLSGGVPELRGVDMRMLKIAALPRCPLFSKPRLEREGFRRLKRF